MNKIKVLFAAIVTTLLSSGATHACDSVEAYKKALATIAPTYLKDMKATEWDEVNSLITQEVLDDACSKKELLERKFNTPLFRDIIAKEKLEIDFSSKMSDLIKLERQLEPDTNINYQLRDCGYIFVERASIYKVPAIVRRIQDFVYLSKGYSLLEEAKARDENGDPIEQHLYIYLPQVGYVIEINVVSAFAGKIIKAVSDRTAALCEELNANFSKLFSKQDGLL